jgi:hypothetical protein
MDKPELVSYLETKGLVHVSTLRNGKEWTMSPCPHCGKESSGSQIHFSISPDNVGFCQVCKQSGNIFIYKKMYGDGTNLELSKHGDNYSFHDKTGRLLAQWKKKNKKKKLQSNEMLLPEGFVGLSEQALWSSHPVADSARNYLFSRGFSVEILKTYKIGLAFRGFCSGKEDATCDFYGSAGRGGKCPKCGKDIQNRSVWLSVPYFSQGKDKPPTLIKYRSLPPMEKDFQRESGGITDIYGSWDIDNKISWVVITEAELDAIALRQLGVRNVLCLAGGVGISAEWLPDFEAFETVYLAGDSDGPGEENIEKWAETLGAFRCRIVHWPDGIKDAAQFIEQGGTKNEWENLFQASERIVGKVWLRGDDLKEPLEKFLRVHGELRGIPTGFPILDKIWGGVRYNEWSVVTGDTGSGKSIWTSQIALNLAQAGVPSAIASFELRMSDIAMRSVTQIAKQSVYNIRNDSLALGAALENLAQTPIYFLDLYGEIALSDLKQILAFGVAKFGVRFIVLDHLHYFLPGLDDKNEKTIIDTACRTFTQWVAEWGIHIVVVVHPKKFGPSQFNPAFRRVDGDMLRGSSGIKQEAFNIISLYRARGYEKGKAAEGIETEGAAEITIFKCRSPLGKEGVIWFKYDTESLLYTDCDLSENKEMVKYDRSGYKKQPLGEEVEDTEEPIKKKNKKKTIQDFQEDINQQNQDAFAVL